MLGNTGLMQCCLEGHLYAGLGGMPAKAAPSLGAGPYDARGEQELPSQTLAGTGILALQGIWQWSESRASREILRVQAGNPLHRSGSRACNQAYQYETASTSCAPFANEALRGTGGIESG